jgi:hypothetical protein
MELPMLDLQEWGVVGPLLSEAFGEIHKRGKHLETE